MEENSAPQLHKQLLRQLKRANIAINDISPDKQDMWNEFLARVSRTYFDYEQDNYLLERSMNISSREMMEMYEETKRTHEKLLTMSRQAGMAEVASSVLHNIGNIMNSANVSINLLKESSMKTYCQRLSKIIELFNSHSDALDVYLTKDEKGKLIPSYLAELIGVVLKEYDKNSAEIDNININLAHIKDIVAMQKAISGTSGFVEQVFVPDVIDSALQVINASKMNLIVEKKYDKIPFVFLDKSKLTQILINLFQNAKDAISSTKYAGMGKIKVIIKNEGEKIKVLVNDNGVGIAEDTLNKIFAFGFTTKDKGHGFGLHNSALLAKEIGGSLKAESDGVGEGSTFILALSTENKSPSK